MKKFFQSSSSSAALKKKDEDTEFTVSAPQGMRHEGHLGFDDKGFSIRNLPPEWDEVFGGINQLLLGMGLKGVTKKEAQFILKAAASGAAPGLDTDVQAALEAVKKKSKPKEEDEAKKSDSKLKKAATSPEFSHNVAIAKPPPTDPKEIEIESLKAIIKEQDVVHRTRMARIQEQLQLEQAKSALLQKNLEKAQKQRKQDRKDKKEKASIDAVFSSSGPSAPSQPIPSPRDDSEKYRKRIAELEAEVERLKKSAAGYTGGSPRSLPPVPPRSNVTAVSGSESANASPVAGSPAGSSISAVSAKPKAPPVPPSSSPSKPPAPPPRQNTPTAQLAEQHQAAASRGSADSHLDAIRTGGFALKKVEATEKQKSSDIDTTSVMGILAKAIINRRAAIAEEEGGNDEDDDEDLLWK